AREQFITSMLQGRTFEEASKESDAPLKRAMAYRLLRAVRTQGEIALQDGRHRSEEHTSELQSPCNLVCRLLLEKKKTSSTTTFRSRRTTTCTSSASLGDWNANWCR